MKRIYIAVAIAFIAALIWGCSQFGDSTSCTTLTIHSRAEVQRIIGRTVIFGDTSYVEVNPDFSPKWHDYTGRVMSLLGMSVRWNEAFDCNRFCNVKLAVIHVRYLVDTWQARVKGQAPAAGEVWYIPDTSRPDPITGQRTGHAIISTIEGGKEVFRDIYSPRALVLSPTERSSIFLTKY